MRGPLGIDNVLTDSSPRINDVPGLLPHQEAAVKRMRDLERSDLDDGNDEWIMHTRLGIYCDPPNSGKTSTVIGLAKHSEGLRIDTARFRIPLSDLFSCSTETTGHTCDTTLVITTKASVSMWTRELERIIGRDRKWMVLTQSKQIHEMEDVFTRENPLLVVVTAGMLQLLDTKLNEWETVMKRVVYDDAETIKIPRMRRVPSAFYWFVCSSVDPLVWRSFHVAEYGGGGRDTVYGSSCKHIVMFFETIGNSLDQRFKNLVVACRADFVYSHSLGLPMPAVLTLRSSITEALRIAPTQSLMASASRGLVYAPASHVADQIGVTLLKAEDIEKFYTSRTMERAPVSSGYGFSTRKAASDDTAYRAALKECEHIRERLREKTNCPICYEECTDRTVVPCCHSSFCFKCLVEWFSVSGNGYRSDLKCPSCRMLIDLRGCALFVEAPNCAVEPNEESHRLLRGTSQTSSMHSNVFSVLRNSVEFPDRSFVVYFDGNYQFQRLFDMLTSASIEHEVYFGSGKQRKLKALRRFEEKSVRILLMNSVTNQEKIFVPGATDIVLCMASPERFFHRLLSRSVNHLNPAPVVVWRFSKM